jgi:hypothetical protein
MTIAISYETIATAISNLTIVNGEAGGPVNITIKDLNAIPTSARGLCPILFPNPVMPVSEIRPLRVTTGGAGSALMNLTYKLNYIYLHTEASAGISGFEGEIGCVRNLFLIVKSILENDNITGAVDVTFSGLDKIDNIQDPSGRQFLGVMFSIEVTEFVQ